MSASGTDTTMQYLHYSPRPQDGALLAAAFRDDPPAAEPVVPAEGLSPFGD